VVRFELEGRLPLARGRLSAFRDESPIPNLSRMGNPRNRFLVRSARFIHHEIKRLIEPTLPGFPHFVRWTPLSSWDSRMAKERPQRGGELRPNLRGVPGGTAPDTILISVCHPTAANKFRVTSGLRNGPVTLITRQGRSPLLAVAWSEPRALQHTLHSRQRRTSSVPGVMGAGSGASLATGYAQ